MEGHTLRLAVIATFFILFVSTAEHSGTTSVLTRLQTSTSLMMLTPEAWTSKYVLHGTHFRSCTSQRALPESQTRGRT